MSKKSPQVEQENQQVWAGALLKGLVQIFSWMPYRMVQVVGIAIGYLLYWLPSSTKSIVKKNLQAVYPNLSLAEQNQLVKQTLLESGKTTAEFGPVWCWRQSELNGLIKEVKGQELVDEALAKNKGIIFLVPHMGNWEMAVPVISTQYPSSFLYRPPNVPSVESFMVKARSRFGGKLAPTDIRGVRTLIKALKNREVTVILPDQDPGESGGVFAPFYNRPARTMTLVSKLIQKTDCAFLFMVVKRLPDVQGFCVHYLPADPDIASEDELQATTALNSGVQSCIELATEQYLWAYKRYRHPPAGVEDIYKAK
ncbi:MAG: Kdo2-lipid IVA lauroyltransferase/acyltransferase [Thiomicrorhabdus sp.]|nr:MAG: Kdo2-lipid IVA lauroyltransferase/acyltransferase [Thiomicrorhabdus sp.]